MLATLADVLNLFELAPLGTDTFQGTQPDPPNHHIVGGQIAGQALMAASRTAPERPPHSLHVYFLRRGDARCPVSFEVTRLHDGGTFSTRRVAASQGGQLLMEAMASFAVDVEGADYQRVMPDVPRPEALVPIERQLAPYADEFGGWWVSERPFDTRYVDPPPRVAMDLDGPPTSVSRIWLRARGTFPADPVINGCVLTYLSALTLLEAAQGPMGKSLTDVSALLDHAVWFHRPADFSDWLLFEQKSPTGIGGRALATGSFFNLDGTLVCTASQEGYFPAPRNN
ncbi:MAG: acyl-CoA thioesterase [Mycobacterium sp.]|jgi:acyl-CoA thioesterase-2|nr:acyl-CoA thioesterase [Mycobacterium sp.]